jgi:hypothetical protein
MAYMRVTRGRWAGGNAVDSEVVRAAVQELYTAVRALPGNQSYMGGLDTSNGISIAVSVWDTAEHAQSLEGLTAIREKLDVLGLKIESSEVAEIRTPT